MEVKQRIAYARGLLEGSEAGRDVSSKALWDNLLQVCDALADSVSELTTAQRELESYMEGMDHDLADLEAEVFADDLVDEAVDADEIDQTDEYVRTQCPACGEEVYFEEACLYDDDVEISCPDCGETLYRSERGSFDEDGAQRNGGRAHPRESETHLSP